MLRAAFVCPCIGIGGADGMMMSLMRNTQSIHWTGVAVRDPVAGPQRPFIQLPRGVKVHQNHLPSDDILENHENWIAAQVAVAKDADIVITWAMHDIGYMSHELGHSVPIIEFAQNEDKHAKSVIDNNDPYVHYRVGCSDSTCRLFPEDKRMFAKTLYNAADPNRVTPRYGRDLTRKKWNIRPEQKVALFLGRLVAEKNPEALIQAIQQLPPEWVALFCGGADMQILSMLRESAGRFAPGRCMFLQAQPQVGDVLAAADVFVLPSDFEGIPLTMLEAWLAGTPTVASDFTCMTEIQQKFGELSVVIPKRPTGKVFAEAILKADSEDFLDNVGRARSIAWNEFTITRLAAQWEEYLHESVDDFRFKKRHLKVEYIEGIRPYKGAT